MLYYNRSSVVLVRFQIFQLKLMNCCQECNSEELKNVDDGVVQCESCGQFYQYSTESSEYEKVKVVYG